MDRIGVIGLGRMGAAIAVRFAGQGVPVTGWTRSGRHVEGVASAPDLETLVAGADVLVTSLLDDAAVSDVLDALLACEMSGKLIVETSTVVPGVVKARAEAALTPLSARIFHVGPLGAGLVMKTVNNAIIQVYIAGLAEQLRLAKRAGLPLETTLTILGGGPAGMPAMRDRMPKMLGQDDTVGFPVSGLLKDHAVFRRVAADAGIDTPALAAAEPLFLDAIETGLAEVDGAAILSRAYNDA
jgi:3-hydroxyisobutyrate dehydrogenase